MNTVGWDGASAKGESSLAGLSADGQTILLISTATKLDPDADSGLLQLFLQDLVSGQFTWVSRQAFNTSLNTAIVISASLSSDANVAVFKTDEPGQGSAQLWRYDRVTQESLRLSMTASFIHPISLNKDGFRVTYDDGANVWLWDAALTNSIQVSLNLTETQGGNKPSHSPILSADGTKVTFLSQATDVTQFDHWALSRNGVMLAFFNHGQSSNLQFTPNDQWVLFTSRDDNLTTNQLPFNNSLFLYAQYLPDRTTRLVSANPGESGQVYVKDMTTGNLELISEGFVPDSVGSGNSAQSQISLDGRYVLFASRARNLVANDDNETEDIFLRDRLTQTTILLSRSLSGGSGNRRSLDPVLSDDGRIAAFRSFANDLVPGDHNLTADIFFVHLGSPDTDQDGLDSSNRNHHCLGNHDFSIGWSR